MKVAVFAGGISPERNVSLTGGKAVWKALKEKGYEVIVIDPALGEDGKIDPEQIEDEARFPDDDELAKFDLKKYIECVGSSLLDDIDAAFLVLHGQNGEDGKIQALLELRGIPYTGSGVKASAVAIDKAASKLMFAAAGILSPNWLVVDSSKSEDFEYLEDIRAELGKKLVIKPNDQGSTIGLTIVPDGNLDDISNAIKKAGEYSERIIAETYIEGRELTVAIVGGEVLPTVEIIPESGFYDFEHKYVKGKTEYECPADISPDIEEFAQSLALAAHMAVGCSGFARADFRMNDDNQLFLLEINTIPGFTATSLVPMAAREAGIDFPELCDKIVKLALGEE